MTPEPPPAPRPLSRWPHSVLPPWPQILVPTAAAAVESGAEERPIAAKPLALAAEEPHQGSALATPASPAATSPWEWSAL